MIYRLTPVPQTFGDLRWGRSFVAEIVWVSAATPAEAREIVAKKTARAASAAGNSAQSPWLSDMLATCAPDTPGFDVPPDEVVKSGGLIARPRS